MANITQEEMRVLLKAQQGELEGVIMYRALADVVKDPKDREAFLQLAKEEGHHAAVFHKLTGKSVKGSRWKGTMLAVLYRIQELTGISDKEIMEAPPLEEALDRMVLWLGSSEVTFYSWSKTDYVQIAREIRAKGIDEAKTAVLLDKDNWVDYQQTAGKRFGKPWRMSLEDALMFAEMELEGKQHDGLVDARNTARLIAKMEKNPESHFLQDRLQEEKEKNAEPLGTSLGSLLNGIRL